ncbi:MAG: glycosyltransferase family 39 protein [Candidatus Omnitrophota bacterium]
MNKKTAIISIFILIIFHLIITAIWLHVDKSFIKLDSWQHYRYSLDVYDFLNGKLTLNALQPEKWHGILVGLLSAFFYFIFGTSQDVAIMINSSIFFPILIFSVYGIGKKMLNAQAGLLAAFILSMYPIIFNNLRFYALDLPLTCAVALSLYLILKSNNFLDKSNSLILGLSIGLGLLIKFNYLAFIAGPYAVTMYRGLKQNKHASRKNITISLFLSFILCALFYIYKQKDILQRIHQVSFVGQIGRIELLNLYNLITLKMFWLLRFTETFIADGLSFFLFVVLIIGFIIFARTRLQNRSIIYLGIIIPLFLHLFIFMGLPECSFRYLLPILPSLAIISSVGILSIKSKPIKFAFVIFLVVLCLLQFFAVSFGAAFLPKKIALDIGKDKFPFRLTLFNQNLGVPPFAYDKTSLPSQADWKGLKILEAIVNSNTKNARVKVLCLSIIPEALETMQYEIRKKKLSIDVIPAILATENFYKKRYPLLQDLFSAAGYVILSNDNQSVIEIAENSFPGLIEEINNANQIFMDSIKEFQLIGNFQLPNNSNVYVYKRKPKQDNYANLIANGNISLIFKNGRTQIFYKQIEITKHLGLYSSILAQQHWRDSSEAIWVSKKINESTLLATGRWIYIPLRQIWRIELKENGLLLWSVETTIEDDFQMGGIDFKIMLSEQYNSWITGNGLKGIFRSSFNDKSWERVWEGNINNYASTLMTNTMPAVKFSVLSALPSSVMTIENSDSLFNSRVIGCSKKGRFKLYTGADSIENNKFQAEINFGQ